MTDGGGGGWALKLRRVDVCNQRVPKITLRATNTGSLC